MTNFPTFPIIRRFATEQAVGVKTYIGTIQYGNTARLGPGESAAAKLDAMEAELRASVKACGGNITTTALMPDAQVIGPNLVFKDSSR